MGVPSVLYAAGLVVGLLLVGVVGVVAVRHQETPGALPLAAMAGGVGVWTGSVLVMVTSGSFQTSVLANKVAYVGIVTVVAAYVAFALDYTGRGDLLTRRSLALLAIEPVAVLAAIVTNPVHGQFWTSITPAASVSGVETVHGPLFGLHVVYSYLLLLAASALLVRFVVGKRQAYRQQAAAVTFAVAVPLAGNALYLLDVVALDLTPLGFAVSGAALTWATVRADFVRLAPVARDAVVETMNSAVFVVDRDGRVADVNPAAHRMLGDDGSLVGRPVGSVLADHPQLPDSFEALVDGAEITVETEGDPRYFQVEVTDVEDARGRDLGQLVVAQEVTERRRREDELRRKNERLDQFAAVVSHDLRNPLSVTSSYVQLARDSGDDEHLEKALAATDRMETIIDDVLALARDGADVQPDRAVDVATAARQAWQTVDTDDATLVVGDPPTVEADAPRLRRLLENLFRNAVEHGSTDPGSQARQDAPEHGSTNPQAAGDAVEHSSTNPQDGEIAVEHGSDEASPDSSGDEAPPSADGVTVTVEGLDDGEGFSVADDGPGIPLERREAVLDAGESTSGGTGLGLAIVDAIVEGHDWDLRVGESDAGGALFAVEVDE